MPAELIALAAAAAVLIFWMVGAHNRITALRNAVHGAWPALDELLQGRAQAQTALAEGCRALCPQTGPAAEALVAALGQAGSAAALVRQRASARDAVAGLAVAEATLATALQRLTSHLDGPPAWHEQIEVATPLRELQGLEPRIALARQGFNDAAQRYNEAIGQFPTRLLAPWLRFDRAGLL